MAFNLLNMLGIGGQAQPNMLSAAAQPQAAPQAPSLLDRYQNFTASDRGRALNDFFTGLAMGQNPQQSLGYGAKLVSAGSADRRSKQQSTEQRNQTVEWLKGRGLSDQDAALLAGNTPALSEYLKNTLAPDAQKPTSDIQNYQFAVQGGYKGNFAQWQKDKGSGVTVNLPGQPNIGTIPQGYAAKQDPTTGEWTMSPIAGGPEDTTKADAAAAQNKETFTDVVTGAADKARKLAGEGGTTGRMGALFSYDPGSDAAELYRQVDVLKSNATIENLNAMRRESKTGGALGNVTEGEGKMLAAKAGALDPKSPYFKDQLADYERTLLRTIHGKDAGDKIFDETRQPDSGQQISGSPAVGAVENGYRYKGGDPASPDSWEKVQ